MPSRIIREGILSSDKVDSLSCEAEVFYRRLLSRVDDHGTFDGRGAVLLAALYPLRLGKVTPEDCLRWVAECVRAGLVVAYDHGGKPFVQVLNTQWAVRSSPKNPLPSDPESKCKQLCATEHLVVDVVVGVDVVDSPPATPTGDDGPRLPKVKGLTELDTWLDSLAGADAIPADDPIFDYGGLPREFLELAWHRFCEDMRERRTRKKDWRAHFRNAVRANWYKLWWTVRDGEYALTTAGEMARRAQA